MNIAHSVERGRKQFPTKPALIAGDQTLSYSELDILANRLANGLRGLGVRRGDRVALLLPNIPAFVIAYLGIQKIGAVAVALNVMLKSSEVNFVLNDCGAQVLISTAEQLANLPDLDTTLFKHLVLAEGEADAAMTLNNLLEQGAAEATAVEMGRDEPAAILYTSGTTGFPKGVTLSHGNVISNIQAKQHYCGTTPNDRLLLFLPMFHCFGQNAILNHALHAGATLVIQRRFDAEQVLDAIARYGITMFFAVPTVYIRLLAANLSHDVWRSVRYFFAAGAAMPPEIARRWQELYELPVYEGYGLTETSPFSCYNHASEYRLGSIGTPIQHVEMRIVDLEGQPLPVGETGEIVVRGPNVMLGYWNRPEETAQVLRNGWFHTGDIGRMDEDGYFYIVDRLKDMVNVAGFKVYPAEVEQVLYTHPEIAEAAVFGIPDAVQGEMVMAHVVLRPGATVQAEEIIAFCRERIANYKTPRQVRCVDALPKNATGKVLKRVLRDLYR